MSGLQTLSKSANKKKSQRILKESIEGGKVLPNIKAYWKSV